MLSDKIIKNSLSNLYDIANFHKELDQKLEKKLSQEEVQELTAELLNSWIDLIKSKNGEYHQDIDQFYHVLQTQNIDANFTRRDHPVRVFEAIANNDNIDISVKHEKNKMEVEKQANAVIWDQNISNESIFNAFNEGTAIYHNIAIVIGFKGNGLHSEKTEIVEHKNTHQELNRMVIGKLNARDIKFILIRIPAKQAPKELLTEREVEYIDNEPNGKYIMRGMIRN